MIEDKKFIQEILGKIKKEKIAPKPKWFFLLKNYVVWFLGFLSLLIGGIAFSVIIYLVRYNDWDIYEQLDENFISFILLTMPYFWILFLALFIYIVLYNIKHTKKGYRYSLPLILSGNIVVSMILGVLFYKIGISQALDDVLGENAPLYSKIINRQMDYWSQPKEGRLSGLVVDVVEGEKFTLVDFGQKEWNINNKIDTGMMEIKLGAPIRVLGKMISDDIFEAEMVLPPGKPGGGLFRRHQNMRFPGPGELNKIRGFIIDDPKFKEGEEKMNEIIKKYPNLQEELDRKRNEEFNVGGDCGGDSDCKLPFVYAVRSNCPFEAKCFEDKCRVMCLESYRSEKDEKENLYYCDKKDDCDCEFYTAEDKKDCICLSGKCGAVVE